MRQTDLSVPAFTAVLASPPSRRRCGKDPKSNGRASISPPAAFRSSGKRRSLESAATLENWCARSASAAIFTPGEGEGDAVLKQLIRAVAVSGFAAANIMLLSVSVWSGADAATRDLFHWVSAMIAGPTLIYAATSSISPPGMRSATGGRTWTCRSHLPSLSPMPCRDDRPWGACLVRRDRDPSVLPAHRPDARLYDARPRTIRGLARLSSRGATVLHADGSPEYRAVGEIEPGERLMIAAGEGIPSTAAWYRHQRPGPLGRQLRERADFGQLG